MATIPAAAPSSAEALLGALADRPGATAADLAEVGGIGRSTAGKLLASLQAEGRVLRQPGGCQDGRRTADRWTPPPRPPTQDPNAATATPTAEKADTDAQPRPESGRLGAGELRQLVLGCLAGQGKPCRRPRSPGARRPVGWGGHQRPADSSRPARRPLLPLARVRPASAVPQPSAFQRCHAGRD
jgi:hypothetical protein